ncbi:hypothetical protein [Pseudofulvibacter geojedonensis]|uniref:Peptidase S74 domain-containing protein n=1 Tax=Pseudofulvibacter geojedonensis TaxID=1123758 RepID=A0ABW3I4L1_9FLAO
MKAIYTILAIFLAITTQAQVGIGTTTPDASSILDIESTTQGMLTPRMNQAQRNAIVSPATGLLIYQTNNTPGFYYYNGTTWTPFGGSDDDWTVSGNDMYNSNSGNIGVGNTSPTAKFHITGTTGGGGTLLNQDFNSYTVIENNSSSGCTVDGWESTTTGDTNANCSSCTGTWIYIDSDESGCSQNATAIVNLSSNPTTTSINISFDYRYNDYTGADDIFRVYLYNNTTTSQVGADLINTTTDVDTSYSGSATVTAGNSYSIRFEYTGIFDYGASIDNVLVTEAAGPATSVFRLEDGNEQTGYVLTSDANGNATWQAVSGAGSAQTLSISGNDLTISGGNTVTLPSGGGSTTADNGLSISGGDVVLGGTLINNTTINLDDNDLTFSTGTGAFPGDIIFEGSSRTVMETNLEDNYINFGGGFPSVDTDDGSSFNDSGNSSYTKDFVAGFYNGSSGGSAIALGSIEYIVDGTSELFLETSALSPMDNLGADLGAGSAFQSGPVRNWDDVYAQDFIATGGTTYNRISGREKNQSRGLAEIMKLEPITYREEIRNIGNRTSRVEERDIRLGFTTNNLLNAIPEAVKTSDWVTLKEGEDPIKMTIDNPTGIMYNQIIPVTVKAIQEQQAQIEELRRMILELKKENKQLKKK